VVVLWRRKQQTITCDDNSGFSEYGTDTDEVYGKLDDEQEEKEDPEDEDDGTLLL
jgi:hypothetical protein